jgi:hypothetical protein
MADGAVEEKLDLIALATDATRRAASTPRPAMELEGFGDLKPVLQRRVEQAIERGQDVGSPRAGMHIDDESAFRLLREAEAAPLDVRLAEAAERLGLDPLERAVLAVCAAPEVDPRFGRVFSYLHDDVNRKLPTVRLVADLLGGDDPERVAEVVDRFSAERPLRRGGCLGLKDPDGLHPIVDRPIRVAEYLTAFLCGTRLDTEPPGTVLRRQDVPGFPMGREETIEQLREMLTRPHRLPILVAGPDAAPLLAVAVGRPLVLVPADKLGDAEVEGHAALRAALEQAVVAYDGVDELDLDSRRAVERTLRRLGERRLLVGRSRRAAVALGDATMVTVVTPTPSLAERRTAWTILTGSDDSEEVAAKFRLSLEQVAEAAGVAVLRAATTADGALDRHHLDFGARQASSTRLGELAVRLEPAFGWDDLVLPERPRRVLRSVSAYLRHRDRVLSEWGYERTVARTQGLKVLFAGESGTGKTMAAQVLIHELGLEGFSVDLATTVSKYIGETEKNLDRIFTAAEGSNAVLFFDEADALFGKRSEVGDAHDRYANIEVAYLLQKMESYPGAVVLATNFRRNIDDAFLRRLDFVIDFPFPEEEDRLRIWTQLLPEQVPQADDIDLEFLARQFRLTGGAIRNCALAAAFEAADADSSVAMRHLIRAVAVEYGKLGKLTLETEFGPYHELIRTVDP